MGNPFIHGLPEIVVTRHDTFQFDKPASRMAPIFHLLYDSARELDEQLESNLPYSHEESTYATVYTFIFNNRYKFSGEENQYGEALHEYMKNVMLRFHNIIES